jgi:hypothetical protein
VPFALDRSLEGLRLRRNRVGMDPQVNEALYPHDLDKASRIFCARSHFNVSSRTPQNAHVRSLFREKG